MVKHQRQDSNLQVVSDMGLCCGGRDRTYDLQVMSLTSYHCSTPRYSFDKKLLFPKAGAKVLLFYDIRKYFCIFFA